MTDEEVSMNLKWTEYGPTDLPPWLRTNSMKRSQLLKYISSKLNGLSRSELRIVAKLIEDKYDCECEQE
tara:strand:+ start:277 stop:483 length:207 start_codon:yes stop_codon:yes gene_type:complete